MFHSTGLNDVMPMVSLITTTTTKNNTTTTTTLVTNNMSLGLELYEA